MECVWKNSFLWLLYKILGRYLENAWVLPFLYQNCYFSWYSSWGLPGQIDGCITLSHLKNWEYLVFRVSWSPEHGCANIFFFSEQRLPSYSFRELWEATLHAFLWSLITFSWVAQTLLRKSFNDGVDSFSPKKMMIEIFYQTAISNFRNFCECWKMRIFKKCKENRCFYFQNTERYLKEHCLVYMCTTFEAIIFKKWPSFVFVLLKIVPLSRCFMVFLYFFDFLWPFWAAYKVFWDYFCVS